MNKTKSSVKKAHSFRRILSLTAVILMLFAAILPVMTSCSNLGNARQTDLHSFSGRTKKEDDGDKKEKNEKKRRKSESGKHDVPDADETESIAEDAVEDIEDAVEDVEDVVEDIEEDAEYVVEDIEEVIDKPAVPSDLAHIRQKGTLVIGITDFEPMDYQDSYGNWIGFDAELAEAFAESLGVKPEFRIIDWDNKVMELNDGTIDLVWNGMTLTDEAKSAMECSNAYCDNAQIVILPISAVGQYPDADSMADLCFAVESGSAGQWMAKEYGFAFIEVADRATTLLEVKSGNADAAIIDALIAAGMTGEGTSYPGLTCTIPLNSEEYGVGCRKGSDAAAALNDFFKAAYEDGSMLKTAEKYGVQAALIG